MDVNQSHVAEEEGLMESRRDSLQAEKRARAEKSGKQKKRAGLQFPQLEKPTGCTKWKNFWEGPRGGGDSFWGR